MENRNYLAKRMTEEIAEVMRLLEVVIVLAFIGFIPSFTCFMGYILNMNGIICTWKFVSFSG